MKTTMATWLAKLLRPNGELETVCMFLLAALQIVIWANDSLCGLSGSDSILRNLAAAFDITSPLLFLSAAYTFIFKSPGAYQGASDFLKRWSKLHSHPDQNTKKGLKVDIRSPRFPWLSTATRVGKIQVAKRSGARDTTRRSPSNTPSTFTYEDKDDELVENYSSFLVPYVIRKRQRFEHTRIRLSQNAVRGAAATTVARFTSFLTWTFIYWVVRVIYLIWSLWHSSFLQMLVYITSETSRAILVSCQVLSLVTYSLQYKGVSSWGSPPASDGSGRTGRFWEHDPDTQTDFRERVVEKIGRNYLALGLFLLVESAWPRQPGWLKRQLPSGGGPNLFSRFADPPENAYTDPQTSVQIKLRVFEGHEIDQRRDPVYTIEFTQVPGVVRSEMRTALCGEPIYRVFIFAVWICSLTSLVAPLMFTIWHPTTGVKLYFLLEQIVVLLLKYDDVPDLSINSVFEAKGTLNTSIWN